MSYFVIKWVKGNPYLYEQYAWREAGRVRTKTLHYFGRASRDDVFSYGVISPVGDTIEKPCLSGPTSAKVLKRLQKHDYVHADTLNKLSRHFKAKSEERRLFRQLAKRKREVFLSSEIINLLSIKEVN